MLDPKFVLENLESVQNRLAARGPRISFDEFVRVSREKKEVLKKTEDLRAVRNKASEEVSRLKRTGADASAIIAEMRQVGDEIGALEERLKGFDEELKATLLNIPNIPHESVPDGQGRRGQPGGPPLGRAGPLSTSSPRPTGTSARSSASSTSSGPSKITGSRFTVYFGAGARLERALIGFMLDLHTARARLHRGPAALHRQRRQPDRHRQPAQVQGGPVQARGLRLVPHPDGRGAADEHLPGRDPRRRGPADPVRRLDALLPERGRARTARTSAASSASTSSTRSR